MNNKAFNIFSNNEEKDFYPNDYKIDTSLDNDIIDFFKSQKNEQDTFYLSKKIKINNIKEVPLKTNLPKIETENKKEEINNINEIDDNNNDEEFNEEEDESSSSSELIYSTFPDNNEIIKNNIYERMHINKNLITSVKEEYSKTKEIFLKKNEENNKEEKNISENNKFIICVKDFNKYDLPKDDVINNQILPFKSNEYLMKNINKCFKIMKNYNKNNKEELSKLSEWMYTFLLFLEMPLSPENSADLYSINKYIYNNFIKTSELKIIFIIICEIFKQILIL